MRTVLFGLIFLILLLSILQNSVAQTPPGTFIARNYIKEWLGVQVMSRYNSTEDPPGKTWFNTVQKISLVSRAKLGVSFFSIAYPTGSLSYLFWRDDDGYLVWSKLTPGSTPSSFALSKTWDDPQPIDYTFGNRYMDVLGDSQNITFFVNISSLSNNPAYRFNYTLCTINMNSIQYSNTSNGTFFMVPDESITVSFEKMDSGTWYLWNNISFRFEAMNPTLFALTIPIYLTVAFLLLIFSRHQPLYSRGIIPHVSNVMSFIIFLSASRNWTNSETREHTGCIMDMFISSPMAMTSAICAIMVYIRYNIMRVINESKEFLIKKRAEGGSARNVMIKFFQFTQKWYTQLLVIIGVYVFASALFVVASPLIWDGNSRDCTYQKNVLIGLISLAFLILIANIPVDIYLSWRQIRQCDLRGIFLHDPLNFKFEIYILYVIIYVIAVTIQASIVRILMPREYWKVIVWSLQFFTMNLFHIWFPLLMTIIRWINVSRIDQKKKDKLAEILNDPEGLRMMYHFARTEFASENVSCYDDILQYEKEEIWEKREQMAKKIFNLYFAGASSPLEVNINSGVQTGIKQELEKGTYQMHLFEKAKGPILDNMCDTYSRLITTPQFKQYRSEKEFLNDWNISHRKTFFQKNRNMTVLQQPLISNEIN